MGVLRGNRNEKGPQSENFAGLFSINLAVTYFPGQLLVKYLRRRRA